MKWFPETASFDHKPEFIVIAHLNRLLIPRGMIAETSEGHYEVDIEVFSFDTNMKKRGIEIRKIDVEQKNEKYFSTYPEPDWPYWSFLWRKVSKIDKFKDDDIYLLCNHKVCDKIYWARFGDIRKFCKLFKKDPDDEKEWYYRFRITDTNQLTFLNDFVFIGYEELASYLKRFKGSIK